MDSHNLLGIPETRLPEDPAAASTSDASSPEELARAAAAHPASTLTWARLAESAYAGGRVVEAYAYARTGYHRSLDQLRRAGWRGQGPVPWEHEPNRGFLRSLAALAKAAGAIGEDDEASRCANFLRDSSREAADALGI